VESDQVLNHTSEIASDFDVAYEYDLLVHLISSGGSLLAGSRINLAEIDIQTIKYRGVIRALTFLKDLPVKLPNRSIAARPANTLLLPVSSCRVVPVASSEIISSWGSGGSLVKTASGESERPKT